MPPADQHFDIRNVSMDTDLEPITVPLQLPKNKQRKEPHDSGIFEFLMLYKKKRFLPGSDAI